MTTCVRGFHSGKTEAALFDLVRRAVMASSFPDDEAEADEPLIVVVPDDPMEQPYQAPAREIGEPE